MAEATRELPTDDARVTRQIVLAELTEGTATTAGDLIDKLDGLGAEGRRQLLDEARAAAGLPTTEEVDARRRFEQANAAARVRGSRLSEWQLCHA